MFVDDDCHVLMQLFQVGQQGFDRQVFGHEGNLTQHGGQVERIAGQLLPNQILEVQDTYNVVDSALVDWQAAIGCVGHKVE